MRHFVFLLLAAVPVLSSCASGKGALSGKYCSNLGFGEIELVFDGSGTVDVMDGNDSYRGEYEIAADTVTVIGPLGTLQNFELVASRDSEASTGAAKKLYPC